MTDDLIASVGELSTRAWQAEDVEELDGWLLRSNHGITRRANSVWPRADVGGIPLEEKFKRVESHYQSRGLVPCFQIGPRAQPVALDGELARRGYIVDSPSLALTAPLAVLLDRASGNSKFLVEIEPTLTDRWHSTYLASEMRFSLHPEGHRQILERIRGPVGFAVAAREGIPAAVGVGILEKEWVGFFCVATRPEMRRSGAATALLHGIADWARSSGATSAYLIVLESNAPARSLYARLGFETLFRYHYRDAPEAALVQP